MALNYFKREREEISKDKFSFLVFWASFLSGFLQTALILATRGELPPQVPIFYSRPWGESMLASPVMLWIFPIICFSALTLNFLISFLVLSEKGFLKNILWAFSLTVAISTLYGIFRIVFLLV